MQPWHSSSLACFSLLTTCLFVHVATVDNNAAQLCDKWKSDTGPNFLAMGIITGVGGVSRFYAVNTEFEGIMVPAEKLHVPVQIEGQANVLPNINLEDGQVLDLSRSKDSWPPGEPSPANGKNAFLLAFKPEAAFHWGEKFLAVFSKNNKELFLAPLTSPGATMKRVAYEGNWPPAGIVFSTDNKVATPDDASVVAAVRYVTEEETHVFEVDVRREQGEQGDSLHFKAHFHTYPRSLTPSLAIDGGFLLNGDQDTEVLFALSNAHRKIYVFYRKEAAPVEVPFTDFLVCSPLSPDDALTDSLSPYALKAAGIAVPVIVGIGAVGFFMSAKKTKNSGGTPSAGSGKLSAVSVRTGRFTISGNSTAGSTAGKSTFNAASGKPSMRGRSPAGSTGPSASRSLGKFKTRSAGKPRTAKKKPRTAKKKPRTANKKPRTTNQKPSTLPGMLARSMESSPGPKAGVFKFKATK